MRSPLARLCIGVLIVSAPCLAGCGTLRSAAGVDPAERAWLRPAIRLQHRVRIVEVDGRKLGPFRDRAELAPGSHEVVASANLATKGRRATGIHRLSFDARPGGEYRVYADWYAYGVRIWIEETASGARVAIAETRPLRRRR